MLDLLKQQESVDVALAYDYSQIAEEHRDAMRRNAQVIKLSARRMAHEVGEALADAKQRLSHGQWLAWLRAETGWSDRTAQNLMAAAVAIEKNENFAFLPATAQYLLGAPSTPPEAIEEVGDLVEAGAPVTVDAVKEVVKRHKPPKPTLDRNADATYLADRLTMPTRLGHSTLEEPPPIVPVDDRPLPDWVVDEELAPVIVPAARTPGEMAARNARAARRLLGVYTQAMQGCQEYEGLVGEFEHGSKLHHHAQHMIANLTRYIDLMEGNA